MSDSGATRRCLQGGAVVGARRWLPEAPFDRWFRGEAVGCNHLHCPRCDAVVRQRAGLRATQSAVSEAVHDALAGDGEVPGTEAHPASRTYACRCAVHTERGGRAVDVPVRDPALELSLPWRCAGHSAAPWPLHLDGLDLDDETDVAELCLLTLETGSHGEVPFRPTAAAWWLDRLVDLHPAWELRVVEAVYDAIDDLSDAAAAQAADLLGRRPGVLAHAGLSPIHARLGARPDPTVRDRSLADRLLEALAPELAVHPELVSAGLALARSGPVPGPFLYALAAVAPDAFTEATAEAISAAPDRVGPWLGAIGATRPDLLPSVVAAARFVEGIDDSALRSAIALHAPARERPLLREILTNPRPLPEA